MGKTATAKHAKLRPAHDAGHLVVHDAVYRVVVVKNEQSRDALGFEYLDGPVTPKPEKLPGVRARPKRRPPQRKPKPPSGGKGGPDSPGRGSVPKVPLLKV